MDVFTSVIVKKNLKNN